MTEERELLRDTVAALVEKHASPAAVREAMDSARGYDESLWKLLCEQVGAAALVVPEEFGGAGGEFADAAVVLEELGKALVPTPLLGTTLAELALLAADDTDKHTLERLAEGTSIGAVVFDADYVVNGDIADIVIAAVGNRLTRWTRFTAHPVGTMDPTRRLARIEPHDTAPLGADPGLADTAAILVAAEQIGAATQCLDLTIEYTKNRVQFGRPIGSFQALKHRMADLYVAGAVHTGSGQRRDRRAVSDVCRARPDRCQRGVLRRRRRGRSDARRHRDHLGARHPAVLQARARQRTAVRAAARSPAPAPIRAVLEIPSGLLFAFNGLEQRLEVADTEAE